MIGQLTEGGIRFDFVINARVPQDYATIATLEAL
jgi:hypothetical protein